MSPDITVIICTYNRADSLRTTLGYLVAADRSGVEVEIIVVDNNSQDATREQVESFRDRIPIRYVFESRQGKTYSMNTGLRQSGLGSLVAFLDDDMAPDPKWFQGVMTISRRWPDCDIFSGNSYVVWPSEPPPRWCLSERVQGWAHSVNKWGATDRPIRPEHWPVGGHFWVRHRALETGVQFDEPLHCDFAPTGHVSDPDFILQLLAAGFQGVAGPDAVTGHRVQPPLTEKRFVLERARVCGRAFQYVRSTYPTLMWQARLLKEKPWVFYALRAGALLRAGVSYLGASLRGDPDDRFAGQAVAVLQLSGHWECLRNLGIIRKKAKLNEEKVRRLKKAIEEKKISVGGKNG